MVSDKPLEGKTREPEIVAREMQPVNASAMPVAGDAPLNLNKPGPMGAYGPSANPPIDFASEWKKSAQTLPWNATMRGRVVVRATISQALGALAFTAGGLFTSKCMHNESRYNPLKGFSEQKNVLQKVAYAIDSTAGRAIEGTVNFLGGDGARAVRFCPTKYDGYGHTIREGLEYGLRGRSVGDEVVNRTFDFFCMSIGAAVGDDIGNAIDPNAKKTWLDDKGFHPGKALESAAKAAFRYVTYNGGEDWAVSLPYVYFIRGQRALLNHCRPGFAYDSDRQLNGGSLKINSEYKIVGNYNMEGIIDLASRFTAYNGGFMPFGTLHYRELYNHIGDTLAGKPSALYGAPDQQEKKGLAEKAVDVVKWSLRGMAKATVYMVGPALTFASIRAPQTKHRGLFINPEKGMLGYVDKEGRRDVVYANTLLSAEEPIYYTQYRPDLSKDMGNQYERTTPVPAARINEDLTSALHSKSSRNRFNAYAKIHGPADGVLNAVGGTNYHIARGFDGIAAAADKYLPVFDGVKRGLGMQKDGNLQPWERFTRPLFNAYAAYAPYKISKSEMALRYDDGRMDMALERMIDGAFRLNAGEFLAGSHEVGRTILQKPLEDPEREKEAKRRIAIDNSPADAFNRTKGQMLEEQERATLSWQERLFSGQIPGNEGVPLEDRYGLGKRDNILAQGERKPENKAEQEALRKALKDALPLTNSIH